MAKTANINIRIEPDIKAQQGKDPCYTCAFFRRGQ